MATDGAGGLSTAAIERCIGWASMMPGALVPQGVEAARAELAALTEAAGRVGSLRAALTHAARVIHQLVSRHEGWDPHQWDGFDRQGPDAIWGPIEAALADGGPGAAGARDEATERAREQIAAGWRTIHDALDWAALRHEPHPDPAKRDHYAHNPANRHLWDAKAQIEAGLAALRAGGAGDKEAADGGASRH